MRTRFELFEDGEGFGANIEGDLMDIAFLINRVMAKQPKVGGVIAIALEVHKKTHGEIKIPDHILTAIDKAVARFKMTPPPDIKEEDSFGFMGKGGEA